MALELGLSISQSNDATTITMTDNTGTVGDTSWNFGENENFTDIVAEETLTEGKYHLTLDVVVIDKNNETTTYSTIYLYDFDSTGPFTSVSDLTWTFDASDLVTAAGDAMGTSEDRLTDGVWTVTYTLKEAHDDGIIDTYVVNLLIDGDVRADVYDALREISRQYDDQLNYQIPEIMEALLKAAYLRAINASGSVSEQENLINMLWTLDKLNSDGSKYDW